MKIDKTGTIRQEIIKLLVHMTCSVRDLSQSLHISEKEVLNHLPHISKSLKNKKMKLIITPYHCISCEYEFENRVKFNKPGKCPKCRKERIEPALFMIKSI